MLVAEVETRRAEIKLRKIELESMKVERELRRRVERGGGFDLNGDTFDTPNSLDTRTVGSEESEEEDDEGVDQVLDAFSIYSVCS